MVLTLSEALGLSLRETNEALLAAGFDTRFAEPVLGELSAAAEHALGRMLEQQEPFPLTILSHDYRLLASNLAAQAVFSRFVVNRERLLEPLDMFTLLFDPELARPFIVDWESLAATLIARLRREVLLERKDDRLQKLLERVLRFPGVKQNWSTPGFGSKMESTVGFWLKRDAVSLGFLTTLTGFSMPAGVITLEELRIESYFPMDEATRIFCEQLREAKVID
jgi:MmyB-like transcription regulator ligand binding domain